MEESYKRGGLSWGDNSVPVVFHFFSVHLKSGLIREVAFGWRSPIKGGPQYGLIREVASGGRSLIRGRTTVRPDKRGGLWWKGWRSLIRGKTTVWPDKRGGLWWKGCRNLIRGRTTVLPDKRGGLW